MAVTTQAKSGNSLAHALGRFRMQAWFVLVPATAVVVWVFFLAGQVGGDRFGTAADSVIVDPGAFLQNLIQGLAFSGLFFIVASGFTLIFGLMRTVNMAHGSLFLMAAYLAVEVQQGLVGKDRNIDSADVSMTSWLLPLLAGALMAAVLGIVMYQIFLRWNQGQDLRQALITIAISVVVADQLVGFFPQPQVVVWPGAVRKFFDLFGARIAATNLFIIAIALLVGGALWLLLNKTRTGMIIRAGVDDQQMVRALGVNISFVFGITFFVGSFLAGFGGVLGANPLAGAGPGADNRWLLNSLVVVIIGGLGSMKGAIAGSLLFGLVQNFFPAYIPSQFSSYTILFTFALLAVVLSVRPQGLFGTAG